MKPFKAYIALFVLVILAYVIYTMYRGPNIHWMITLDPKDKNPFGAYVLNERMTDIFTTGFDRSYQTISQLEEDNRNILIIANQLELPDPDMLSLFERLEDGAQVLIAANAFNKPFLDTLNIRSVRNFRFLSEAVLESRHDTLTVGRRNYSYPYELIENFFELTDSADWKIEAHSVNGITGISRSYGAGRLTVVNTPLVFTNFGLLYNENHNAAESLLTLLPDETLHYTQFYQLGKSEASTPLRYFLREPPLRWSLYLALFTIAVLLVIDSWRKQRFIRIMNPPENTSISYARTLGGLFYREGDHATAAQKMISHFLHQIREKYYLEIEFSDKFYAKLAGKMGKEEKQVKATLEFLKAIRSKTQVSQDDLIKISKKIDELA